MQLFFYIIPLLILIPTAVYLYLFFKRIFLLILKGKQKPSKVLGILVTAVAIRFAWPAYGWGGVVILHLLMISLIIELINHILKRWVIQNKKSKWDIIYRSGILSFLIMAMIFSYGYYNMYQIREKKYSISSEKIKKGESLRIVLLSDIHLGTTMDAEELTKWSKVFEEQQPDMVLLAGDIFDEGTKKAQMQQAAASLGSIESTYGTYFVYGNHDYNNYKEVPEYFPGELTKTLEAAGIRVLEDKAELIDNKFYMIGRQDATVPDRLKTNQLTGTLDSDKLMILMDHQPGNLQENAVAGIDLQVSGHTHAGQIWPTGQMMTQIGINEVNYGYKKIQNMQTIVSSGLAGWGYPIRTGGHCEYVIIDIKGK